VNRSRCVMLRVRPDIDGLIKRALQTGEYANASSYLRNLVIQDRLRAGDRLAMKAEGNIKTGRPRVA